MRNESGEEVVVLKFVDGPLREPGAADVLGPDGTLMVEAEVVGGWPPPERLMAYFPRPELLGLVPLPEGRAAGPDDGTATYRRTKVSELPDDAADSEHLVRGAEYEHDGDGRGGE